ncbi:MAG: hypothetical protein FRX49_02555 [Trebouxia sp. A1-2]|nr:MAG: hypothetical protein FRX49_02555 [Trebouxia sp. A1-2]
MRQEHLAAIANLNTFAKKRSSKSPYSASGSDSGSCQSASRHSTPTAASISPEHHQQLSGGRQQPPSIVVYNSSHVLGEPGWSDEPVLADASPVLPPSSQSVHEASDWCQDDSGQDQSSCQAPTVDPVSSGAPANLEMPRQPHISTTADALQGQPLVHAANLSSFPLLAQDSSLGASTSSPCADSADFDSSQAPKAAAASSSCDSLISSPAHSALESGPPATSQLLHQPSSQVEPLRQPSTAAYKAETTQNDASATTAQRNGTPAWPQLRQDDAQASLASRESIPDESLIAEGWIVAGTIMSNRDYRSDGENAVPNISSAASMASTAVPQKASPSQSSSAASAALSDDELAQLTEELSVLSEQPRSQMTPQQIGRYLDIRIRLGRAGSVASKGRHQAAVQAAKPAVKEAAKPTRPSPTAPIAGQHSNSGAKPDCNIAASRPRKADGKTPELPASRQKRPPEKRGGENSARGYVPAYMKATASVKAKDARDQQAKIAAARSALSEKKWNRA